MGLRPFLSVVYDQVVFTQLLFHYRLGASGQSFVCTYILKMDVYMILHSYYYSIYSTLSSYLKQDAIEEYTLCSLYMNNTGSEQKKSGKQSRIARFKALWNMEARR